jgi:outer membrane protein TolC
MTIRRGCFQRLGLPALLVAGAAGCSSIHNETAVLRRPMVVVPQSTQGPLQQRAEPLETADSSRPGRTGSESAVSVVEHNPPRSRPVGTDEIRHTALIAADTASETPLFQSPPPNAGDRQTYAVDLPSVLQMADANNPQVAFARERIQEAYAQWDRAETLWLPSLRAGVNWNKHEGRIQDVAGGVIDTSRGSYFTGLGANAVGAGSPAVPGLLASFHLTDALFQPRIAERATGAMQHASQAATNDTLLETSLAYLELLRAAQEVQISREPHDHTRQLMELTKAYAESGQGTQADYDRAQTELAIRTNDIQRAEEAVLVATARLAQLLHLDPTLLLQPHDPAVVPIEMVSAATPLPELVAQGLTSRPEVCEHRFLVGEAVQRLKREQYAPLIPSVLLGLSYGGLGGGFGSNFVNFGDRLDADAVAYWEVRNLGFGERAARCEAESKVRQAQWREVAALDRVAREVVEAHAQTTSRRQQIATAEAGVKFATGSYERNLERIRNAQGLPLEVLQSIQALAQARREYLRTVVDYNAAQFRLHHSLGWPEAEG